VDPVGEDHVDSVRRRSRDPEYRRALAASAPFEALARLVIAFRVQRGLTQEQLAALLNTSAPAISRLESGDHQPSLGTLRRFGELTGRRLVVGFEDEVGEREVVAV
jgi:ribosome-binding protein aMBF1 (putative translation factor)